MKPLLLRHLSGESLGRFPVWMMRQAGRYLPSYQALRAKHSFWEMATQPELAVEVTLLPIKEMPLDGVILFSDILTLPYGMGLPIEMQESIGPTLANPLTTLKQFEIFAGFTPQDHTRFVGQALEGIRSSVAPEIAALGFAGAPWTVGSYLVNGRGKKFDTLTAWMARDPQELTEALSHLGDATLKYLLYQAESGADTVQLFDTWLCEMPRPFFLQYYLPLLNRIFAGLRAARVPSIYFTKQAHHLLGDFTQLQCDVLSVDGLLPLTEFEKRTEAKFSLQGNLDPLLLFAPEGTVRQATRLLVQEARRLKRPAILNLAHGLLPKTPVATVKAFVEEARTLWI